MYSCSGINMKWKRHLNKNLSLITVTLAYLFSLYLLISKTDSS